MSRCTIKADDFYATKSEKWRQFLLLCNSESIPASLGFIAKQIRNGKEPHPPLVRQACRQRFTLWNHGLRHWQEHDTGRSEFLGPSVEEQLSAINGCQEIAESVFGERPRLFGPPFNAYDANTIEALSRSPEIEMTYDLAWHPKKPAIPKHYFVSCDVGDSGRRFDPERARKQSADFIARRSPFVIQIHPGNHWEEDCFERFRTFVRSVRASGYRFVPPHRLLR